MTEENVQRFDNLPRKAAAIAHQEMLPHVDPLSFSFDERKIMFEASLNLWKAMFKRDKLLTLIDQGSSIEESVDMIRKLRKSGQVLKSAYLLFDATHYVPSTHHKLIKLCGKYADEYEALGKSSSTIELRDAIKEYTPPQEYQLASDDSYRQTVTTYFHKISGYLNEEVLGAKDFHKLRKTLRYFMNLLQLHYFVSRNAQSGHIYHALLTLNQDLGNNHDRLMVDSQQGTIEYDTVQIQLDNNVRKRIVTALGAMGFDILTV